MNDELEQYAKRAADERVASFRPPRPETPYDEAEVEVLADALEGAIMFLSGGEVQRGGEVPFQIDGTMEKGKFSPSMFAGLSALADFIEQAREDNPELARYAFDAEDVARDRGALLDTIEKLMDLQEDQQALLRMRKPVRAASAAEPEPAPEDKEDALEGLL